MKKVKIQDKNFAHVSYSSDFQVSKYFTWDRNLTDITYVLLQMIFYLNQQKMKTTLGGF